MIKPFVLIGIIAFLMIWELIFIQISNDKRTSPNSHETQGYHEESNNNHVEEGEKSMPLCRSEDEYRKGQWVWNSSINSYPYLSDEDYIWGPMCTMHQNQYMRSGWMPDFLKYQWQPDTCRLAHFDREDFCRRLDGKTIGIIGDSMGQQFAHSLMGLALGKMEDVRYVVPSSETGSGLLVPLRLHVPLCSSSTTTTSNNKNDFNNVTMIFYRWNKYNPKNEKNDQAVLSEIAHLSDYLVMNWGVHYLPWTEMEQATHDFIKVLETSWPPKKTERLFWRSTVFAIDGCSLAKGPDIQSRGENDEIIDELTNTNEILMQDREIVRPLLRASSLNVTMLRVEDNTHLRGDGLRVVGKDGKEDCLHFCEPGPTDSWVELFYHFITLGI